MTLNSIYNMVRLLLNLGTFTWSKVAPKITGLPPLINLVINFFEVEFPLILKLKVLTRKNSTLKGFRCIYNQFISMHGEWFIQYFSKFKFFKMKPPSTLWKHFSNGRRYILKVWTFDEANFALSFSWKKIEKVYKVKWLVGACKFFLSCQ